MIVESICGLMAVTLLAYYWSISTFKFWDKLGVIGPKPCALVGNLGEVIKGKMSIGEYLKKQYETYNEPFIGVYFRREPALIIKDLNLIKDILISDFSKFHDRPIKVFEKADPLSQNLLSLEYGRWRPLRHKLSPVFTSGKLKEMFYLLLQCGDVLQTCINNIIKKNNILEVRDLTARFTTDVIGTCAFGLNMKAMDSEEDSEFRKMGKEVFKFSWKKFFFLQMREIFPGLYEFLAPIVRNNEITDFFVKTMNDTMSYRRQNNIVRHDFLDYLMEIKDHPEKLPEIQLTDELLASQLFIFFAAGFETSSSTMANILYELAQHDNYQDKLREEIRDTLKENNGKLTYDSVKNMKFLDMVFKEASRKYPIAATLLRKSNANYTFNGTNITIPKDIGIMISVLAIHHDPKIYPNPDKFNPYNFTEEAVKSRHPMSFLSFGDGSRNCIGARFAYQQTKVGIIKILERHQVDVCEKTEIPYKVNPKSFLLAPLNGIYLKFTEI